MSTKIVHAIATKNPNASTFVRQRLQEKLSLRLAEERDAVAKTLIKEDLDDDIYDLEWDIEDIQGHIEDTEDDLRAAEKKDRNSPLSVRLRGNLNRMEKELEGLEKDLHKLRFKKGHRKSLKESASVFKCQECGKKYSRPVEECSKCGGSDIDLAESNGYSPTRPTKTPVPPRGGTGVSDIKPRKVNKITEASAPPSNWATGFEAPYQIAGGGKETPFLKNGKWYLYVFNKKTGKHEYYSYSDDLYMNDIGEYGGRESMKESIMPTAEVQRVYDETGDIGETELLCGIRKLKVNDAGEVVSFIAESLTEAGKPLGPIKYTKTGHVSKKWAHGLREDDHIPMWAHSPACDVYREDDEDWSKPIRCTCGAEARIKAERAKKKRDSTKVK